MALVATSWLTAKTVATQRGVLLAFSGCDYLGLSHHPKVLEAARQGLSRHGLGSNGSRVTTGTTEAHLRLEAHLAAWLGTEKAHLAPSGTVANTIACELLRKDAPRVVLDERCHASLRRAAGLIGRVPEDFVHRDLTSMINLIRTSSDPCVVLSDGVFSASGDVAPATELLRASESSVVLMDDSHALGVLNGGRGSFIQDTDGSRRMVTASLGKAFGCFGGVVAGPRALLDTIERASPTYVGSTPIPAALAETALAALELIQEGSLVTALQRNVTKIRQLLQEFELTFTGGASAVFSFCPDDPGRIDALSAAAIQAGLLLPLLEYPGGPAARYFRLAVNATHNDDDLQRLADVLALGLS